MSIKKAADMYREFNDLDPKKVKTLKAMPTRVRYGGRVHCTMYASKKWGEGLHNYKHDHDSGVKIYFSGGAGDTAVPASIVNVGALAKMGRVIGIEFTDPNDEDCEYIGSSKHELYCTPNGRALVVVVNGRVDALIWGGKMHVEARGIVF